MENKRVYVTLGKTQVNVQRMKRVSAHTNMMKLIEIVQKAEVEVVAQDQADPAVQKKEKERKRIQRCVHSLLLSLQAMKLIKKN